MLVKVKHISMVGVRVSSRGSFFVLLAFWGAGGGGGVD